MRRRARLTLGHLVAVTLVGTTATCSGTGDLSIQNESSTDVTVVIGEDRTDVTADGGVVLLDNGCTDGDVTVEYPEGRSLVVPGPVCPEDQVVIRDDAVDIEPADTP